MAPEGKQQFAAIYTSRVGDAPCSRPVLNPAPIPDSRIRSDTTSWVGFMIRV